MIRYAALPLALCVGSLLGGCAMTPEQQDRFRANFMGGLGATQPYQVPLYQLPVNNQPTPRIRNTDCIRTYNGGMNCTTY